MMRKERKRQNQSKSILKRFDFLTLSKVSGTLRVVLHLDSEVLLVPRKLCSMRIAINYTRTPL